MELIVPIAVALVLVVVARKVLKGLIKTVALVAIVLPLIMRLRGRGAVLSSLAANED